jgi:hypothetical protein
MPMSLPELERALRGLRLSGMTATLEARALQVASHEMDFLEALSWLVQDELDRRRTRLQERRYARYCQMLWMKGHEAHPSKSFQAA